MTERCLPQELVILSGSREQSQTHRTSEIIWSRWSPSPDWYGDHLVQLPCSEQGQWKRVTQGCVLLGFEYLQGW